MNAYTYQCVQIDREEKIYSLKESNVLKTCTLTACSEHPTMCCQRNAGYIYFPAAKLLMTFHDLVSRSFVRLQLSIECAQRDDEVHSLLIENARLLIKSYTVGEFLILLKVLIKVMIMLRLEHLSYGGVNFFRIRRNRY